jgi:hypothetical protein
MKKQNIKYKINNKDKAWINGTKDRDLQSDSTYLNIIGYI